MITQITDLPSNMVGFRASGEVTKEDYNPVLKTVEELVERTGRLNFLLYLDTSPANFTIGAWMKDMLLGVKNLTKWNRAALISDSEGVIAFTDAFSKVAPGEFRGFKKSEYDEAVRWTSEETN